MTPDRLLRWLLSFPFPGALAVMQGDELTITLEGEVLRFDGAWRAPDGQRIPHTFPEVPNADDIHAEIRRGLAITRGITGASWHNVTPEPAPSWEDIKADCVGPDLPGDDARQNRITDEIDRRRVPELERERDAATSRAGKVEDRLRRDDELREQIAAAVGLDGSASLALIFDTVNRDRPAREIARLSGLLDVLAAPVTFGERRLSTAERAEWALRRALRERDEVAPRMAQLIDAEVMLDCMGVPAYAAVPSDDPGDASEALTVAERLRLHFGARS